MNKRLCFFTFFVFLFTSISALMAQTKLNVLVFSKTAGFRHESIGAGTKALTKMAKEKGFTVSFTEDAAQFNNLNLAKYKVVIFLNTTGDILNKDQEQCFERFIQAGGGYVGIHAATDTEYDWPWYNRLAGAYFLDHPIAPRNVQNGKFYVVKRNELTEGMPDVFERKDEFYSFKDFNKDVNVVVKIDEKSYIGGKMGDDHPISWFHEFDGGRSFYTAMGHTDETFSEALFLNHLYAGIKYAAGGNTVKPLDYSKARPEENRFTKVVLEDKLDEPVELTLLDKDRILFIQRKGEIKLHNLKTKKTKTIATLPVSKVYTNKEGKESTAEDGLIGLNKDPNFAKNGWVYLFYSSTKGSYNQLSRFTMKGDELLMDSEKEMLKVDVQREECCHTGGSIAWDKDGNMYISTGDNTNPHASKGYSPSDERAGRGPWDAQKSSSNTNDLRGKILRIKPQPDGSYTIPVGNLFPVGTPKTRPEIYTMGHRNPYRISVDQKTGFVYWGDVGPDARNPDSLRGPAGHDEVGQAKKAGNFGWPHFIGNNKAYTKWDFVNDKPLTKWEASKPINTSPNNTGLNELPPAQSAFLWYTYGKTPEFPLMGDGGRNAMAGPVFYSDQFKTAPHAFPSYYNNKLIAYEWMRGWLMAVTMDAEGNYVSMEKIMPSYKFSNPMDMEFAENGDLYMLEYGTAWFQQNDDARLIRIEYNSGNRSPKVNLNIDKEGGAAPLAIKATSNGTSDPDGDVLKYKWLVTSKNGFKKSFATPDLNLKLEKAGVYKVELTATDSKGGVSTKSMEVVSGNEPPVLTLDMPKGNKSFYANNKSFDYSIKVNDAEDGSIGEGIDPLKVIVNVDYLAEGYDKNIIAMGHRDAEATNPMLKGKRLIEGSDCMSCHKKDSKSIGPNYREIARKYRSEKDGLAYLSKKIIQGGGGVWGETAMAAHPSLSIEDANEMAKYIMNINRDNSKPPLEPEGTFKVKLPKDDKGKGVYIVRAAYTDTGNEDLPQLRSEKSFVLRNAKLDVHDFDEYTKAAKMAFNGSNLVMANHGSWIKLSGIDLNSLKELIVSCIAPKPQANCTGGQLEVRIDKPDGNVIGKSEYLEASEAMSFNPNKLKIPLSLPSDNELHDLYICVNNRDAADGIAMILMGTEFVLDLPDIEEEVKKEEAKPSGGNIDFFIGKWEVDMTGGPNGDIKTSMVFERKDGKIVGEMIGQGEGALSSKFTKVEEIDEDKIKAFFNINGMDLDFTATKDGADGFSASIMNMVKLKGVRKK
jgi:cytochrome c